MLCAWKGDGLWLSCVAWSNHDGWNISWAVFMPCWAGLACLTYLKDQRSQPAWRPPGIPAAISSDLLFAKKVWFPATQRWQRMLSLHFVFMLLLTLCKLLAFCKNAWCEFFGISNKKRKRIKGHLANTSWLWNGCYNCVCVETVKYKSLI